MNANQLKQLITTSTKRTANLPKQYRAKYTKKNMTNTKRLTNTKTVHVTKYREQQQGGLRWGLEDAIKELEQHYNNVTVTDIQVTIKATGTPKYEY